MPMCSSGFLPKILITSDYILNNDIQKKSRKYSEMEEKSILSQQNRTITDSKNSASVQTKRL
jgi:hypothetical protein